MSHHGGGGGTDIDSSECKSSMLWNWYTTGACFLSPTWNISSGGIFAASCIGVCFLAVALEVLRRLGKDLDKRIQKQLRQQASRINVNDAVNKEITIRAGAVQQFFRAIIHAATMGVAYILMLLIMYFNGYIFFSILLGAGLGKFLCDWMTLTMKGKNQEEEILEGLSLPGNETQVGAYL